MTVLLNKNHELRSGWKLTAYAITFLTLWFATGAALSLFFYGANLPDTQLTLIALNEVALLVPAIATLFLMRFVDRRPVKVFGVGLLPHWRRDFITGLILAAAMVGLLLLGCYAFGYVHIEWTGRQVTVPTLAATVAVLLLAAATEELMFRSFPLQILSEGVGMWPAVLILSGIFGLLHIRNPNVTLLAAVNTAVAGILLSLAYMKTRSLWLPYGIHFGWNLGLGFILGFPLSGVDLVSLWTTGVAGSETILGGNYGPEGGLLATFVFASSALTVYRRNFTK